MRLPGQYQERPHYTCTKIHLRYFEGKWRVDWAGSIKGKRTVVVTLAWRGAQLDKAFGWCRQLNAGPK